MVRPTREPWGCMMVEWTLKHRFAGVDHHFVVNALEQHALHHAGQLADVLAYDHDVLRADDHVHRRVLAEAGVHAGEV